jgi:hypothetical protein
MHWIAQSDVNISEEKFHFSVKDMCSDLGYGPAALISYQTLWTKE